ncbi:MAG: helix-turn-helix domain-containing protein [Pseudomonadota bacterium]
MAHSRYDCGPGCPVAATLDLIGGKWKGSILYLLLDGPLRFNVLRRLMGDVAERTLSLALKDLQASGLIARRVIDQAPPAVEYRLTEAGETLRPAIIALRDWGLRRLVDQGAAIPDDRELRRLAEEFAATDTPS